MKEYALRVLLVDDQPLIGEAVRRALAGEPNLQFRYCANALEALGVAEEFKPTVILLDLVMPGVEGFTLMTQFRAHAPTARVPIIVLSSKEQPSSKSAALAYGANDYLIKLPQPIELIACIRHHSKAYLDQLQK
jgi:PleD family two-component response regulator